MTAAPDLEPLFADNHLLALAKPAGLPCVPDNTRDESLLDRAREWIRVEGKKPGAVFVGVVHRLDRPVSGVVLFARTSKAAGRLSDAFRTRSVTKHYLAVGAGAPPGDEGVLEQWLWKDEQRNTVSAWEDEARAPRGARRAVTSWRVLERRDGNTLFAFEPETGRPHQLRVAAASLGCPLLGDLRYGAERPLSDRSVALHALRLELEHPVRKEPLSLRAAPPDREWWRAFAGAF